MMIIQYNGYLRKYVSFLKLEPNLRYVTPLHPKFYDVMNQIYLFCDLIKRYLITD